MSGEKETVIVRFDIEGATKTTSAIRFAIESFYSIAGDIIILVFGELDILV